MELLRGRKPLRFWVLPAICAISWLQLAPFAGSSSWGGTAYALWVDKLSPLLAAQVEYGTTGKGQAQRRIRVIVQVDPLHFARDYESRLRSGKPLNRMLRTVSGYSAELTIGQIELLAQSDLVRYVTLDPVIRPTHGNGRGPRNNAPLEVHTRTIGAHLNKAKGKGIKIAVFDSGVSDHTDLPGKRVKMALDFTRGSQEELDRNEDGFGHGTHVAGIIAGQGKARKDMEIEGEDGHSDRPFGDEQRGAAYSAEIIDLKVIGDGGWGYTSDLIRAIDWVVENHKKEKIRVANLSLGHPPVEGYQRDPLCAAVRSMVDAGIVTVVSAGNLGRTEKGAKVWGSISSPGIEPTVITVGAINTMGTLTHGDDLSTTYSSRGPTIDGLFKPDIVAPGNTIPSTLAEGSVIEAEHPELKVDDFYLELSGSSHRGRASRAQGR